MKTCSLMSGAKVAVEACLGVSKGEAVLVVTDFTRVDIAKSLVCAATYVGADASLLVMERRAHHGQEPPAHVREAMKASDVVFLVTEQSLTHTEARMAATRAGARIASMPGISEHSMLTGAMTADYKSVRALCNKLADLLDEGSNVTVESANGTNLQMSIEGRSAVGRNAGSLLERGDWGNLPSGEAAIAPIEKLTNGVAVIDGSMAPIGLLSVPIEVTIRNGEVSDIRGGREAEELRKFIGNFGPEARMVGELGIGTNNKARITGNILEDEKVLGTIHIALGANTSMGGCIKAKTHNDGIILQPTVTVDDRQVLSCGRLLVDA